MKMSSIKSKTYLSQLRYKPFFNSFFTYTISSIRPITSTFRNFANLIRSRIRGHFSKRFSTAVFKGFCVHHREIPVPSSSFEFRSSRRHNLNPCTRNDPFVSFSFTNVFVPLFLLVSPPFFVCSMLWKTRQDAAILPKINRIRIVASLFVVLAANSPPRCNRDPVTLDSNRTCSTNLSCMLTTNSIPRCCQPSMRRPLWILP